MHRRQFLAAASLPLLLAALPARAASDLLRIRDLYNKDLSFSPYAKAHEGRTVAVRGYMAPPLKAQAKFFVLTSRPMAVCPFCESEAEWPDDILVVYTDDIIDVVPFNVPIEVEGGLELGTYTDTQIGFVSRVRITSGSFEKM
ncbi:hypothetical protein C8N35_104311 [Breoghania corrubedonensis]|uniref:Secreted protein n=1 Tax=Breoghania corrubedonensis TaxID=665038 RepID=A0A2T5VAA7_9HYPH|nr:hypothetical protein [Breoghania corrubedonensis]PTW60683.1 hypothetical protein C8N35_104311 [Breoghania corrubedonensis]